MFTQNNRLVAERLIFAIILEILNPTFDVVFQQTLGRTSEATIP